MTVRIQGYDEGVAYAVVLDPDMEQPTEERGIITGASPETVLVHVTPRVGETIDRGHMPPQTVSLTSVDGIIAALQDTTEVVAIVGLAREPRIVDPGGVY